MPIEETDWLSVEETALLPVEEAELLPMESKGTYTRSLVLSVGPIALGTCARIGIDTSIKYRANCPCWSIGPIAHSI
jgi:hypothetical protein